MLRVAKGSQERYQNKHRATTRAAQHAQSARGLHRDFKISYGTLMQTLPAVQLFWRDPGARSLLEVHGLQGQKTI
jgi:hypothetical protein